MPQSLSPADAHAKYLQMKKKYPTLTPAAWRKAAAQELGMDYNTYLEIWKQNKGAKAAQKLVAEPKPTLPAAQSPGPKMVQPGETTTASAEPSLAKTFSDVDNTVDLYQKGLMSQQEMLDDLKFQVDKFTSPADKHVLQNHILGKTKKAFIPDHEVLNAITESAEDVIMTHSGPLTHDLAQSVYKQMKKNMPGATPAVWRHNAAKYLGVDYNDYLLAWKKKPGTGAIKKLPVDPNVALSPSKVGKYANSDIDADQLKAELCTLYGPGAEPNFISLVYDEFVGSWSVQFPNSLLKSQAAKDKVAQGLEQLGLKVVKKPNGYYEISTSSAKKTVKANIDQIKQTGTYTLPDGKVVLDINAADVWTESWWKTLNAQTRDDWKNYTGSGYRTINDGLRHGSASAQTRARAKRISDSMPKVDHQMMVFRGSPLQISSFRVGELWRDKGFMSTAINPGGAWQGVKFEITCPKGTKGMYIGKRSSHPSENEFLLDKDTEFRVLEVDTINKIVRMVAIPH